MSIGSGIAKGGILFAEYFPKTAAVFGVGTISYVGYSAHSELQKLANWQTQEYPLTEDGSKVLVPIKDDTGKYRLSENGKTVMAHTMDSRSYTPEREKDGAGILAAMDSEMTPAEFDKQANAAKIRVSEEKTKHAHLSYRDQISLATKSAPIPPDRRTPTKKVGDMAEAVIPFAGPAIAAVVAVIGEFSWGSLLAAGGIAAVSIGFGPLRRAFDKVNLETAAGASTPGGTAKPAVGNGPQTSIAAPGAEAPAVDTGQKRDTLVKADAPSIGEQALEAVKDLKPAGLAITNTQTTISYSVRRKEAKPALEV